MSMLTVATDVAHAIRRAIFDGELEPGMHLRQDVLAERFGTSRLPVREALVALSVEGWVTLVHLHGAYVSALDAEVVRDGYELAGGLHGQAARTALVRAGCLDAVLAAGAAVATAPIADLQTTTEGFHAGVVRAARPSRFEAAIRASGRLAPIDFFVDVPEAAAVERVGVAAIVDALANGDGDAAAAAYARLAAAQGELVVQAFARRGLV